MARKQVNTITVVLRAYLWLAIAQAAMRVTEQHKPCWSPQDYRSKGAGLFRRVEHETCDDADVAVEGQVETFSMLAGACLLLGEPAGWSLVVAVSSQVWMEGKS